MEKQSIVPCLECSEEIPHALYEHLSEKHHMSARDYVAKHGPDVDLISARVAKRILTTYNATTRKAITSGLIEITLAGVRFPVRLQIPQSVCLPAPANYVLPDMGEGKKDTVHILTALRKKRPVWIYGPTGAGKDAIVHYVSSLTRLPSLYVEFRPDSDPSPKIAARGFKDGSTVWEEGELLRAIRDGYGVKNSDGSEEKVPYLVLLSDIDRATPEQLELFRPILDSIEGRVCTPDGKVYPVFPGTQFVATANTAGDGSNTVQYVTAQAQDVSMLNRFEVFARMNYPDWSITAQSLRTQFPELLERCPALVDQLGDFVKALRKEGGRTIKSPFSHRDAVGCFNHISDMIEVAGLQIQPDDEVVIFSGLRSWFHRLPHDAVQVVLAIATTHMKNVKVPKSLEAFP